MRRQRLIWLLLAIMLSAGAGIGLWLAGYVGQSDGCGWGETSPPSYPQSATRRCVKSQMTDEVMLDSFDTPDSAQPIIDFYTAHAKAVSATAELKAPAGC